MREDSIPGTNGKLLFLSSHSDYQNLPGGLSGPIMNAVIFITCPICARHLARRWR